MARPKKATSAATLGFEATLWAAADKFAILPSAYTSFIRSNQ